MRTALIIALSMVALTSLSGCTSLVASTAIGAGVVASEERSIGEFIDDKSIIAEIHHLFIQADVNDLLIDVDVRVHEGRVLLFGRTARAETALEAVRIAWLAKGVREVINEIKIGESSQPKIVDFAKDNWIETQIEARLLATRGIKSTNYTVEVIDGVAYLLGVGQNEQEIRNATRVASVIKGVRKVVSYVRLKDDPRRLATPQ